MNKDKEIKARVRKRLIDNRNVRMLLFTLILLSEVFALINHNFLSTYNLVSIAQSLAPYAMLSLGAIFPIALGYTDLSSGALCIASAVVAGKLYALGMPLWAVIPVMIVFGTLIGLMNGALCARLKLPPFIVTLGTMMFIRGFSALFANQPNILFPTDSWYNRTFSTFRGLPMGFVWVLVLGLGVRWFFKKSRTGRHLLAVGSNEKAAMIAGLDTTRLKVLAFTVSGMMSGIAAIFWSASFATLTVATGNGMELDALAGAYIGGSAAAGGFVHPAGAVIGATLLVIIRNGLNFVLAKLNVTLNSTYVTYVITGIIVVLSVFLDKTKQKHGRSTSARTEKENPIREYVVPGVAFLLALVMLASNAVLFVRQKDEQEHSLAVLLKGEDTAFWRAVATGAEDAADEYGYKLMVRGPGYEDSSLLPVQRDLMSVMLSENPAAMGVATIADGFIDLLEEAYDRNVPVIQYDSGLYASDAETIAASDKNPLCGYVKGDNYNNAALVAEAVYESLADRIALSDSFTVGIIQHADSVTAAARADGFLDRFTELTEADPSTAGKCTIYVEVKNVDPTAYKEALEALYEKGASLIYMTAEPVINPVYDAVAAAGDKYDGMYFAGFDSGEKARQWLFEENTHYLCGVSQDPYTMGHLVVETLVRIARGETVEAETVVPGVIYNRENCAELLEKMVLN